IKDFHVNALHDADVLVCVVCGLDGDVVVIVQVVFADHPHTSHNRDDDKDGDNQRPTKELAASARLLIACISTSRISRTGCTLSIRVIYGISGMTSGWRHGCPWSTFSGGGASVGLNDLRATV